MVCFPDVIDLIATHLADLPVHSNGNVLKICIRSKEEIWVFEMARRSRRNGGRYSEQKQVSDSGV